MRFFEDPATETGIVLGSLKSVAEDKLRDLVEKRIREDLESVVKELTDQFIKEFKPEVETYISQNSYTMMSNLDVRVTVKDKK